MNKEQIAACYSNAREQIKCNNPRAARAYVLQLLNAAVATYYSPSISIVERAKTAAFLDRWLAVSRDLYDKGITSYVYECFNLKDAQKSADASARRSVVPASSTRPRELSKPKDSEAIDFDGLINRVNDYDWGEEIFAANQSAVVQVSASAGGRVFNGTGFIISENGYLLTNDHVVFDERNGVYCKKLKMSLVGDKKMHGIEVLFSDKKCDVALCRSDPTAMAGFRSVKRIDDYSRVKAGAECLIIGNAFGMGLAPCKGNIRFPKNDEGNLVYTAQSNPGDSGGPVFNRRGECIGINKSKIVTVNGTVADGYANATPMDAVDKLLEKWTSGNEITL